MATTFDKASLVMIPSGVKEDKLYSIKPTDGSGDFTFSRGSDIEATRVNSSGLIEKAKENLLTYSNTFDNAAWIPTETSITSGQSGYDGTNDAWKLTPSAVSGAHRIIGNVSGAANSVITLSVYAKADGYNFIRISENAATGDYATFNLTDGSVESNTGISNTATTTSVGGGWYRCSFSVDGGISTRFDIYVMESASVQQPWSGNGTDGILIQDAQLNHGLVAQDYVETTTTAVVEGLTADLPRLDYSGGASCPSLLLEPSRTNLVTQSEYFGDSSWIKSSSVVVTSNAATSPEGVQNASLVSFPSSTNRSLVYSVSGVSSNTDYTFSVYIKQVSGSPSDTDLKMTIYGDVVSSVTNNIGSDISGEWQRFDVTATTNGAASGFNLQIRSEILQELHLYGAVCEAGSYPTSYIPTYGTAAVRGADSCLGAGDVNTFNSTEGVLFWEGSFDSTSTPAGAVALIGAGSNRVQLYNSGSNVVALITANGSTSFTATTSGSVDITSNHKYALKWALNDFALWVDGVEIASSTSGATFSANVLNELRFSDLGSSYLYANNNKLITFNTALTDSELTALTTI